MNEVDNELELSRYLKEWLDGHYPDWHDFYYYDVCKNKKNGIYRLYKGDKLMDLLDDIMGNIEYRLMTTQGQNIIPSNFSSIPHLIRGLVGLKAHVDSFLPIIEENHKRGNDNYIISTITEMMRNIDEMVDRCTNVYSHIEIPKPYESLIDSLNTENIPFFIDTLKCILKGVPYLTRKRKFLEGDFQIMLHLLLTVLGFEPNTEAPIADGRIDMIVKTEKVTYIFEFKYTDTDKSQAKRALNQIKDKGYADAYKRKGLKVVGVGVSFSGKTKNINGYESEEL